MFRAATVQNQTHTNCGKGKNRFHAGELSRKGSCEAIEGFSKPSAAIFAKVIKDSFMMGDQGTFSM